MGQFLSEINTMVRLTLYHKRKAYNKAGLPSVMEVGEIMRSPLSLRISRQIVVARNFALCCSHCNLLVLL